jgi:hypothetical protein
MNWVSFSWYDVAKGANNATQVIRELGSTIYLSRIGDNYRTGLIPLHGDPKPPRGGVFSRVTYDLYEAWFPQLLGISSCMMAAVGIELI